ncbi:S41 family peptidase [Aurantiacibacter sp. D1-12]|uniref:S41 family peptidase n=1 Tax=Aurantiacibacter sp. D1-12 TaxID=2993658 RepID=UPI00237C5C3A|nr:S41 family peptidase [Aurantiacibacter sp. D1-12]MDE1468299.1 S41 family peptidase [Aurantiacibacter sp. D1-12]
MLRRFVISAAVIPLCLPGAALAQTANDPANEQACEAGTGQQAQLRALENALTRNYVFPANVPQVMAAVRDAADMGRYDNVEKGAFAERLAEDLVEATGDPHFAVGIMQPEQEDVSEVPELNDPSINYGFQAVQLLPGNIGYLRFDNFSEPDAAYQTATSALKLLENADGLIIDLRYNNGGHNELGQFIASHLFSTEEDHLFVSYYYNKNGSRIERGQWALSAVPGRRHPDMPVHILTSNVTFSAAEWMTHSLQELGRVTVIGGQTAGGGHPVERFALCDDLYVQVPIGELRGPNGGEFEGVGVAPDIAVPSYRALRVSHLRMLEGLGNSAPSIPRDWAIAEARAAIEGVDVSDSWLQSAAGEYSGRELVFADSGLNYRWADRFELRLTPLSERLFLVEGTDSYRIELLGEGTSVTGIARVFADGTRQVYERSRE